MGNALVEAKKAGEQHFEVLLAGEMSTNEQTRLHEIESELTTMFVGLETSLVHIKVEQSRLLDEAFILLGNDTMTFSAWINSAHSNVPFNHQEAFRIRHLGAFCKNKDTQNINVSCLYELAKPKWTIDSKGGDVIPEKKTAVSIAYKRVRKLSPRNQTVAATRSIIEDELLKADQQLPPSPPVKKLTVIQMESKIERLLNDVRMGFSGEDRESLKRFIIAEMGGW